MEKSVGENFCLGMNGFFRSFNHVGFDFLNVLMKLLYLEIAVFM